VEQVSGSAWAECPNGVESAPKSPIASGTFPLLIANEGTFKLPAGAGERAYIFALNPVSFSSTQQGIQASWKSAVQFKEQTHASSN
uniref:hypothetical protein n=6 Tax=Pseudomonas aeruginosa TaxID=287 RepID=UPI001C4A03CE